MSDPAIGPEEYYELLFENLPATVSSMALLIGVSSVAFFIGLLSSMALAFHVRSYLDGKAIGVGPSYALALERWPAAIWTSVVQAVLFILLFLLFIIPGVIYFIYWLFAVYAVALSGKSGKEALDHGKSIVKGRWWKTLGYMVLSGLFSFILSFPFLLAFGFLSWSIPDPAICLAIDTVSGIVLAVTAAYASVLLIVLYLNYEASAGSSKREY